MHLYTDIWYTAQARSAYVNTHVNKGGRRRKVRVRDSHAFKTRGETRPAKSRYSLHAARCSRTLLGTRGTRVRSSSKLVSVHLGLALISETFYRLLFFLTMSRTILFALLLVTLASASPPPRASYVAMPDGCFFRSDCVTQYEGHFEIDAAEAARPCGFLPRDDVNNDYEVPEVAPVASVASVPPVAPVASVSDVAATYYSS